LPVLPVGVLLVGGIGVWSYAGLLEGVQSLERSGPQSAVDGGAQLQLQQLP